MRISGREIVYSISKQRYDAYAVPTEVDSCSLRSGRMSPTGRAERRGEEEKKEANWRVR